MNENDCMHQKIENREFTGIWVVNELKKDVELGYIITDICIIWAFETTVYNKDMGNGGLHLFFFEKQNDYTPTGLWSHFVVITFRLTADFPWVLRVETSCRGSVSNQQPWRFKQLKRR